MRWLSSFGSLAVAVFALSSTTACGGSAHKKRPHHPVDADATKPAPAQAEMTKGTATGDEWHSVEGFGLRIRVPEGWEYGYQGALVYGVAKSDHAAIILVGAENTADAKTKLAKALEILKLDVGGETAAQKTTELNGVKFVRWDYESAKAAGNPAHATVLAADSSTKSGGLVLFVGYSYLGEEDLQEGFRDAINSISPG